jgi:peptidoglycan/xylan/chitin deacetylase (PgdA/CDA1 family)
MMTASLPILTFHALDDLPSVISVKPQVFRQSLARLHARGYRTLRLEEAIDYVRQGEPFPLRTVVITFDDGYRSVYDVAFPVLQRHGMSATIFLTVGGRETAKPAVRLPSLGGRTMLSWREIREMWRSGIDFGAHTLTHPDLTHLPHHQLAVEMCESKAIIEDMLGVHVPCFAYPFGRYDQPSYELARQHFSCASSDRLGLMSLDSDLYALKRVDAYYLRTTHLFKVLTTGLFPGYVRARNIPRQLRRTLQRWTQR